MALSISLDSPSPLQGEGRGGGRVRGEEHGRRSPLPIVDPPGIGYNGAVPDRGGGPGA